MHGGAFADDLEAHADLVGAEHRADLYAALNARQFGPDGAVFLKMMAAYRLLGVVDLDTEHQTVAALHTALSLSIGDIGPITLPQLARTAIGLAETTLPSRAEYQRLLSAAYRISKDSGSSEIEAPTWMKSSAALAADDARVDALRRSLSTAHRAIFGLQPRDVQAHPCLAESSGDSSC